MMKRVDLTISKRLIYGPIAVLMLLIVLAFVIIDKMRELSYQTHELYEHPYTVSNASRNLKINVLEISMLMKDISVKKDSHAIVLTESGIAFYNELALNDIGILKDKYLGDRNDIGNLELLYSQFYAVVEQEIEYLKSGEKSASDVLMHGTGVESIRNLLDQISRIVEFATSKGEEFYTNTQFIRNKVGRSTIIILFTVLVVVAVMSYYIRRGVLRPIKQLSDHIDDLSKGDISTYAGYADDDEINSLGHKLNELSKTNRDMVEQVSKIAEGNFKVDIKTRSEKDKLVIAVKEMADKLRKLDTAREHQEWLIKGQNQIYSAIKGINDINVVAKKVIDHICGYLDYQVGALFIKLSDREELSFVAGHAYFERKKLINSVKKGEGIVGQVYRDRESIILTSPPDEYTKIKWSHGYVKPEYILALPLIFEEKVIGVIELSTYHVFDEKKLDFLHAISHDLVNIFQNILQFNHTKDLLDMLEVQRNEYRQAFDAIPFPLRIIDRNYNSLYVNKGFAEILNMNYRDINKLKCHEVFKVPGCFTDDCPINSILRMGENSVESEVNKYIDGNNKTFKLVARPIKNLKGNNEHIVELFIPKDV